MHHQSNQQVAYASRSDHCRSLLVGDSSPEQMSPQTVKFHDRAKPIRSAALRQRLVSVPERLDSVNFIFNRIDVMVADQKTPFTGSPPFENLHRH